MEHCDQENVVLSLLLPTHISIKFIYTLLKTFQCEALIIGSDVFFNEFTQFVQNTKQIMVYFIN